MKCNVITRNEIQGIHYWEGAIRPVEHLKYPHMHNFIITCKFRVTDADRQLEIILQQEAIRQYIEKRYGRPANFGKMSCEMIAEEIVLNFEKCVYCKVLEDGFGGAEAYNEEY